MKGIKKTLMAGLLTCAALNHAKAEEAQAFSYGARVSGSLSAAVGYGDDVKFSKEAENQYFDCLWFAPELYVGYTFSDYIGMQLNAGYMKQGGSFQEKAEKTESKDGDSSSVQSIAMHSHGIHAGLYLSLYPLGLEKGEDTLTLSIGSSAFVPFATTCKKNGTEITNLRGDQKKEIGSFDVLLSAMAEYEFASCGVSIIGKYNHGFMSRLNIEEGKSKIFDNMDGLKTLRNHSATIGIGYNFASLFSE